VEQVLLTRREHLGFKSCLCCSYYPIRILHEISYVFCCLLRFSSENDAQFVLAPIWVVEGVNVLFMLFVFINAYWCPARFLHQVMLVSFNSKTTGITSEAGTSYPSGVTELTTGFRVLNLSLFCVEYCRSLFVVLSCCRFFFWSL
jgi:hypothetical protein